MQTITGAHVKNLHWLYGSVCGRITTSLSVVHPSPIPYSPVGATDKGTACRNNAHAQKFSPQIFSLPTFPSSFEILVAPLNILDNFYNTHLVEKHLKNIFHAHNRWRSYYYLLLGYLGGSQSTSRTLPSFLPPLCPGKGYKGAVINFWSNLYEPKTLWC